MPDDGGKTGKIISIVDTGSAPHAASHKKHVPGSTLRPSTDPMAKKGFPAVNGSAVENPECKEMEIAFSTDEGQHGRMAVQDCNVEIPIISGGKLADAGNYSEFHDTWGRIVNKATKQETYFKRMHGVYFIWLHVDEALLPQGFGRQGN